MSIFILQQNSTNTRWMILAYLLMTKAKIVYAPAIVRASLSLLAGGTTTATNGLT